MGLYLGIEGESYFVFDESGIKIFPKENRFNR